MKDMLGRPDEQLTNAGVEESEIDQILADSFPASDAPPWTLGVTQPPTKNRHARRKLIGPHTAVYPPSTR